MREFIARAAALGLAALAAYAASVDKAKVGDLGMDAEVVTDVDLEGLGVAESDPLFAAAAGTGMTVNAYVAVKDTDVATHFPKKTHAGLKITEKGVDADWRYTSDNGSFTGGTFLNTPFSFLWTDIPILVTNTELRTKGGTAVTAKMVGAYPLADGNSIAETVRQWDGYWGGSNVYWEVTNYIGSAEIPKLRLLELHGEGADAQYREVWNDTRRIEILEGSIGSNYVGIAALKEELKRYAPTAWGCYTDRGDTNVVAETTWMANPQTVFAGGTEYQRVAVGDGAICVLTTKGAPTYTAGEAGTFRFQDAGGTNYFGFSKSDSYTIGCNTDGISVGTDGLVTLTYNAIMADDTFPVVYYAASLNGGWEQLNDVDGSAADGASIPVTWGTEGTAYKAYVNLSGVAAKTGFFRAETSVAGGAIFETNMRARLDGGIECVNTANGIAGVIRPKYDGTTVKWEWSAQ